MTVKGTLRLGLDADAERREREWVQSGTSETYSEYCQRQRWEELCAHDSVGWVAGRGWCVLRGGSMVPIVECYPDVVPPEKPPRVHDRTA